ncbi:uncharacterized protein LOC106693461 [Microplitis demolitor]|uniref:uncharacterized protein LOC106693461 n=1 Tax=Microplitis demolitor TaxID=69319 RepID=UPI0006D521B8|nr:uncharacterized protein LOC106693461 [Microplitis demolitor]
MLLNIEDSINLKEYFTQQGLEIIRLEPTHHTKSSHTWIEICAVSNLSMLIAWRQSSQPFLSGHDIIYASIKYQTLCSNPKSILYRPIKNISADAVENFIANYDMELFESQTDINSKLDVVNSFVNDVLNAVAPEPVIVSNRPPVPWMTTKLRALKRKRDACYRASKRNFLVTC